ncbi:MAG: TetR/AcrR family transcriptional regulator [Actinomycetota bacterium]|nr:TetR/AcrR family transcriptional regulator [Actinomycetota bacterium]
MTVLGGRAPPAGKARERILAAAYDLFAHRGIQAVGIDSIVAESGVARQTLYRHFASKQDLVLAFLQRRDELWTKNWLQAEVQRRGSTPDDRLLAIFDVFDEWFRTPDFEGCTFINVMLETSDRSGPVHLAGVAYLAGIRQFLEELAGRARIADPESFGRKWHILMKGSIVSAGEGDRDAALRAREVATLVLGSERRLPLPDGNPAASRGR